MKNRLVRKVGALLGIASLAVLLACPVDGYAAESTAIDESELFLPSGDLVELTGIEVDADTIDDEPLVSAADGTVSEETAYWEQFSSDLYYDQLSDTQKAWWDATEADCLAILTGNTDVEYTGFYPLDDSNVVVSLCEQFAYSHPQYYFLEGYYYTINRRTGELKAAFSLYEDLKNGQTRAQMTAALKEQIDACLTQIDTTQKPEEIERAIVKLLSNKISYNLDAAYNQTVYSSLVLNQTVCAGYTQAMTLLGNACGLETAGVTGTAGGSHAWNLINIHGYWYELDVTWMDQSSGIWYQWYNRSDTTITDANFYKSPHLADDIYSDYVEKAIYDSYTEETKESPSYFTVGDYEYFIVNNNANLDSLKAISVQAYGGAKLSEAPDEVTYNDSTYQVKDQIISFVERMYTKALNRDTEEAGRSYWVEKLMNHKMAGAGIAQGFIDSDEFTARNLSDSDYADTLYRTFFDREPDTDGKDYWIQQLSGGATRTFVLSGFVNSQEFSNLCDKFGIARGTMQEDGNSVYNQGVREFVERIYTKALNRDGETMGIEDWSYQIVTGTRSAEDVAKLFFASEEFLNRNLNNSDYVETLYETFMGRASDETGKADWVGKLDGGTYTRDQVLEGFSQSAEFAAILASYGL